MVKKINAANVLQENRNLDFMNSSSVYKLTNRMKCHWVGLVSAAWDRDAVL